MVIKKQKLLIVNFMLILIQRLIDTFISHKYQICYSSQ